MKTFHHTADSRLYIGLMSGTSVDGIDTALVEIDNNETLKLIDFYEHPLPDTLKTALLALNEEPNISLRKLSELENQVASTFRDAILTILKANQLTPQDITAIGSHGQTIYHAPDIPMTLQIGHPAFIAKQTGITTAADFRVDDMALGGQGAPFAPAFHQHLFASDTGHFVVNIGGIANVSYLSSKTAPALGWDTGPGNGLLDAVCQQHFNQPYDKNGVLAQSGSVHSELLQALLSDDYFQQAAPKSTGRDYFSLPWVEQTLQNLNLNLSAEDLLATLVELTAITISDSIKSLNQTAVESVTIVGGGAYNDFLLQRLQTHLPSYRAQTSQALHINPSAIEAMLCAWLAHERFNNRPVRLSSVTGASRDAVLGGLWHP